MSTHNGILKLPEQVCIEWMPKRHVEKYLRKHGGKIINQRVAGLDKDMNPVTHYLVQYNRPRFTGFGS